VPVTFAGGWRIEEYAETLQQATDAVDATTFAQLARRGAVTADVLASKPPGASLEGYLAPGTYQVVPGQTSAASLLEQMVRRFAEMAPPATRAAVQQRLGLTVHQWVTLASIVERMSLSGVSGAEAGPAVRARLAEQLLARLRAGECLCVDVTIQFALGRPGDWWPALSGPTRSVLPESPYNTYTHRGLPPGPICNPSADTLHAVAALGG
jgi:UPF0755 protein